MSDCLDVIFHLSPLTSRRELLTASEDQTPSPSRSVILVVRMWLCNNLNKHRSCGVQRCPRIPQRPQLLFSYSIILTWALWMDRVLIFVLDLSPFLLHSSKYSNAQLGLNFFITPANINSTHVLSILVLLNKSPERLSRVLVPFTQSYLRCRPDTEHRLAMLLKLNQRSLSPISGQQS